MQNNRTYLLSALKIFLALLWVLLTAAIILLFHFCIRSNHSLVVPFMMLLAYFLLAAFFLFRLCWRWRMLERQVHNYCISDNIEGLMRQKLFCSRLIDRVMSIASTRFESVDYLNHSKNLAQYLALQNQINPHFLYNTLECIRSEAVLKGMDDISSMTEALATYFRYTISNVDNLVTVEDELKNVENYYTIQHYRFEEKISLKISLDKDSDSDILKWYMPKLILQPIVENAIYHGLESKVGQGELQIHLEHAAHRLIIRISDDGVGMPKERVNEINSRLLQISKNDLATLSSSQKHAGIAIVNVNNRIKLLFGEVYGVHINSTENIGTDVEITLPVQVSREL